jgi:tetratricopeptide (TPR) repeat protein
MTEPRPASGRLTPLALLGLVALVALVHGSSVRGGFVYDDAWTVLDNPVIRDPANLSRLLGRQLAREAVPDAARPVLLATEMVDWALWGRAPAGYHLQNLLWHAAVVLLLFVGLQRLTASQPLAGIAAGLFAVHPLLVEPVAAINYREDLLAAAFLLGSLLAVAAARAAPPGGRARLWRVLAFACALAACLSKENAVLAAGLLMLIDLCASPGPALQTLRRGWVDYLLLAAAAALVLAWRWWALGDPTVVSHTAELADGPGRRQSVPLAALTWFAGLGQLLWPARLSPEYPDVPATAGWVALGWGALLALFAGGALALRFRRRLPFAALGLLLAIAAYLPHLGLVPLTNGRADRYFYLPAMGACLALAVPLAAALARWRRPALLLLAGVLLALGLRSVRQTRVWRTERSVFTTATAAAPGVPRAWLGLARAELHEGQTLRALADVERALALADEPHARETRGLVRMRQGDLPGAQEDLRRALAGARGAHRARVLNNLGFVELSLGRFEAALAHFSEARGLAPRFDRPWLNAAEVHRRRGEPAAARALLERLVIAIPESIDGWKQLGEAREAAGEKQNARAAWKRARALSPEDPGIERALGRLPPG